MCDILVQIDSEIDRSIDIYIHTDDQFMPSFGGADVSRDGGGGVYSTSSSQTNRMDSYHDGYSSTVLQHRLT